MLVGATGFVGRLTAQHLATHAPAGIRIALAGRSADRLAAVQAELGAAAADWPLITMDSTDPVAVAELARRTTVVATTVGPYLRLGLPLVQACAAAGTHYADLTGEPLFVRRSIDESDATAHSTGARIVHSCGFDSVPSDLAVGLTAARVAADREGELATTVLHVRSIRGGLSGGTIDSLRGQFIAVDDDPGLRPLMGDPLALIDSSPGAAQRHADPAARTGRGGVLGVRRDAGTGRWTAPFVMGGFNRQIVLRSNALNGNAYGPDFSYREVVDTGSGPLGAVAAAGMAVGFGALAGGLAWSPSRSVLDRLLPKPGEGPSEQARARGRFVLEVEAETTTSARYRTRFAAPYDPGYNGTAVMLGESALALAGPDLPEVAGVLTPMTAIGAPLVDRLRAHRFDITTTRV